MKIHTRDRTGQFMGNSKTSDPIGIRTEVAVPICQVVTYHQEVLADVDLDQVEDLVDLEDPGDFEGQADQVEDHPEDLEDQVDPAEDPMAMGEDLAV